MTDWAMATSPKTPTARKAPAKTTPRAPKTQRQRKASGSQASPANQRKATAAFQASPSNLQQRRAAAGSQASAMAGNKRKIKVEDFSPTKMLPVQGGFGAGGVSGFRLAPAPKRQKTAQDEDEDEDEPSLPTSALSPPAQFHAQTQTTPLPTQQPSTTNPTAFTRTLLLHALRSTPTLLPSSPSTSTPLTSTHLNAVAHAMWQLAFTHGALLQTASQYSAMFSWLKLSALARLGFLPSWWFFRDMAGKMLRGMGWSVDDGEMEGRWGEACRWCKGVGEKMGGGRGEGYEGLGMGMGN